MQKMKALKSFLGSHISGGREVNSMIIRGTNFDCSDKVAEIYIRDKLAATYSTKIVVPQTKPVEPEVQKPKKVKIKVIDYEDKTESPGLVELAEDIKPGGTDNGDEEFDNPSVKFSTKVVEHRRFEKIITPPKRVKKVKEE